MFHQTEIAFTGGGHMATHYSPFPWLNDAIVARRQEPCLYDAQERLIIYHRGEMLMCCDDIGGEFNLGNINDSTLADLWWSERHQEIVTTLATAGGRAKYPFCWDCPR
jgi:radical SAM protein with 4Fe4S-binding SPASM domain